MTWLDLALVAGLLLALAAAVALAVALRRERRGTHADLSASRADAEALRERLDRLESRLSPDPAADAPGEADGADSYVITDLTDHPSEPPTAARVEGRLFADLVLRETVVKAAGLVHGVRRAASPEARFRMRYAYGREVKAARKRRRIELRRLRRVAATARPEREDAA